MVLEGRVDERLGLENGGVVELETKEEECVDAV